MKKDPYADLAVATKAKGLAKTEAEILQENILHVIRNNLKLVHTEKDVSDYYSKHTDTRHTVRLMLGDEEIDSLWFDTQTGEYGHHSDY